MEAAVQVIRAAIDCGHNLGRMLLPGCGDFWRPLWRRPSRRQMFCFSCFMKMQCARARTPLISFQAGRADMFPLCVGSHVV